MAGSAVAPAAPEARPGISIRRALTLSFSAVIVLLAASLMVLALLERRQARTDLANAVLQRALARTNGDLTELFAPVKRQLAIDWHEVRMGNVPRYDAQAHARYFTSAFRELPMVGSMMVGDTAGHQLLLMRYDSTVISSPLLEGLTDLPAPGTGGAEFYTRDFRPSVRGEQSIWQLWDPALTAPVRTWRVQLPGYRTNDREWYRQALSRFGHRGAVSAVDPDAVPSIAWSDVYTFFTTREPGLSASFAARGPTGEVVIVAYDILLDAVSEYTRAQRPTADGRVLVVSDSGWLIGLPGDPRFEDRTARATLSLLPVERLADPAFSAWAGAWRARGDSTSGVRSLTVDGARWWGGFRPLEIEPGRRFWIGVMVPERDVLAQMGSGGTSIVLASVIALLVAFGVAARLSRSVADPLAALAESSGRIANLDVVGGAPPPPSRFREIQQLSAALEEMRHALEENFAEREMAARALAESESKLLQSQKLEAVGQLAGGVAHDFNNLLTAIRGYTALLREHLADDPVGLEDLQEIDAAAQRASDLTSQLLAFSRRQHVETKLVDVNDHVASAAKLLARLMDERITLETVYEPDLPAVRIDPGQLHQVLVNLAVNARDAMPDGGTLTISTSRGGRLRTPGSPERAIGAATGAAPVVISVVDTGSGMTPEVRARVFEPFFTTKEKGRGTGLGLATCWGIVNDAGGTIEIDSAVGTGTVMRVILPAVADAVAPSPTAIAEPLSGDGGETVLLVEDEDQIRALAERALTRSGYRVLTARDGVDALEKLDARGRPVDLVLTDVVMPRMGGPALARAVRERWPLSRVLFMTGYAEADAFGAEGMPATAAEVLRKPFTPSDLVGAVRGVIDMPREH